MLEPRAGMASGLDTVRAARLVELGAAAPDRGGAAAGRPARTRSASTCTMAGSTRSTATTPRARSTRTRRAPRTLGGEGAGEVDGRLVLVAGEGLGFVRDGVWAQAAIVPRDAVVEVPEGVAAEHAAAMGIAGLTALNCVRALARVTAADRVIVLGASGGVGSMIVSLARPPGRRSGARPGRGPRRPRSPRRAPATSSSEGPRRSPPTWRSSSRRSPSTCWATGTSRR